MEFEIIPFYPKTASTAQWAEYHKFRRRYHNYIHPDDPIQADDIAQRNTIIQLENPEFQFSMFGVTLKNQPDELIGTTMYGWFKKESQMYEQNQFVSFLQISILPEFRRNGIGTELLAKAVQSIKAAGKKFIVGNTEEEDGRLFAKKFGANEALASVENRLQLSEVDWDLMKQWVSTGEKRNPKTKIEFLYEIPENIIKHYAEVYTETLKQVPMGELEFEPIQTPELIRKAEKERKAQDKIQLTLITVEEDGEISGLTELIHDPHLEVSVFQNLTSVREHHRGRGLGKWLKAAALLKAKDIWPKSEYVRTGNATSNAPMLAINEKMGFKIYKQIHSLQATVESVENALNKIQVAQNQ